MYMYTYIYVGGGGLRDLVPAAHAGCWTQCTGYMYIYT